MASGESYSHKCPLCPKSFTRAFTLRNHLTAHSGEKPFSCTVCPKRFARDHDRKVHEKEQHTGAEFPCRCRLPNRELWGCEIVFSRKSSLQRHLNSDIGRQCRPSSNGPPSLASNVEQNLVEFSAQPPSSDSYDASVITQTATRAPQSGRKRKRDSSIGQGELTLKTARTMMAIPRTFLNHSPSMRDIEVILLQINLIWQHIPSNLPYQPETFSKNVSTRQISTASYELGSALLRSLGRLDMKISLSLLPTPWEEINAACKMAETAVRQEHKSLLPVLLSIFYQRGWAKFPDLRLSLLQYFASMAQKVLQPRNPLAVILRSWQREETLINSAEPAFRLMLHLISEQTDAMSEDQVMKVSLYHLFTMQLKTPPAIDVYCIAIANSIAINGPRHPHTLFLMRQLGLLYVQSKSYDKAEKICLDILSLEICDRCSEPIDVIHRLTLEDLAHLYMTKVEYAKSEKYWRRAIKWFTEKSTAKDMTAKFFFYSTVLPQLEVVLKKQGKWTALERLRQQFPVFFSTNTALPYIRQNREPPP